MGVAEDAVVADHENTKEQLLAEVHALRERIAELERRETQREPTEERLQRQAQIIDQVHDAVIATDLTGLITSWSKGAERLYGYQADELLGQSIALLHPEADRATVPPQLLRTLLENGTHDVELRLRHKSGQLVDVHLSLCLVRDGQGAAKGVLSYSHGISDYKRVLQALSDSESLYQSLVENLPLSLFRKDRDGHYTFANSRFCRTVGRSLEHVLGKTDYDFSPRDLAEKYRADDCLVLETEDLLKEVEELHRPTGDRYWIQVWKTPVYNGREELIGTQGIFWDITDHRLALQALRASEERYRLLFERNLAGVFRVSLDGSLLDCNDSYARILGHSSREEILGANTRDFYCNPKDRETFLALLDKEPVLTNYEICMRRRDGSPVWVLDNLSLLYDGQGNPILEGTVIEITERKEAEEALRRSQRELADFFENAPVGCHWSGPGGLILHVNRAELEMLGYRHDEYVGHHVAEFHVDPSVVGQLLERLDRGETIENFETRMRCKDGSIRHVLINSNVLFENGNFIHTRTFTRDVTELKRAEEERLKFEAKIQHAQKLESLGVLAGGIAHDFNNLLTGILGNASLALMDLPPESPCRFAVQQIEKAALHAADLTKQMLAYSGRGRFVIRALNLSRVVEDMVNLLQTIISKKAVLRCDFAPNLPTIEADPTQLRQVIMNLITNASDAIGEKSGVITIRTGVMQADRDCFLSAYVNEDLPDGYYVYLEITDTGCGMEPATITRIFDPFFTTKFTGRGLGLAAVLGIVRGHHGTVKVYSEVGRGTTFKVLFPCSDRGEGTLEAATIPELWRGTGTILVVDDEETVRTVAKRTLEWIGFQVLLARDGREGVDIFQARASDVVAVLLDLTMPQMGGEEVFHELRRLRSDVRVILMSGYNEQEVTNPFVGKGLAGFIQKPFRAEDLLATLRRTLDSDQVRA